MIFRLRRKRPIIRPKIEQGGRFLHSAVLNFSLKPLAVLQVLSGGFRFVCLAEYQKSPRPWGRGVLDFSIVRRRAARGAFFRLTKKYTRRIGRTLFATDFTKLQNPERCRTASIVSFGIFCFLRCSLKSSRQMMIVAEYLKPLCSLDKTKYRRKRKSTNRNKFVLKIRWCGRQDLNLHGVTTRSLVLRVCQFRHDRSTSTII